MKLDFKYLEKQILKYNAKSEYRQSSIIILRNIFKEAEEKQCDMHIVSRSLPRYKEVAFEADEQANKNYEDNEDESDAYFSGFINCFKYIKERIK